MQENTNRLRIIYWQACQQEKLSLFLRRKISAKYWKKGPSLGTHLFKTVSCLLEDLAPDKKYCQDKKCQHTIGKKGTLPRHILCKNRSMPTQRPHPKKT